MKKGEWHWEELGKLLLALVVLLLMILAAYAFRDKMIELLNKARFFT